MPFMLFSYLYNEARNEISVYSAKSGLLSQYGSFISRVFSRIFPYHGIGENYGNLNFQPFSIIVPNITIIWKRSNFHCNSW